jgi:hypothetical protein
MPTLERILILFMLNIYIFLVSLFSFISRSLSFFWFGLVNSVIKIGSNPRLNDDFFQIRCSRELST